MSGAGVWTVQLSRQVSRYGLRGGARQLEYIQRAGFQLQPHRFGKTRASCDLIAVRCQTPRPTFSMVQISVNYLTPHRSVSLHCHHFRVTDWHATIRWPTTTTSSSGKCVTETRCQKSLSRRRTSCGGTGEDRHTGSVLFSVSAERLLLSQWLVSISKLRFHFHVLAGVYKLHREQTACICIQCWY